MGSESVIDDNGDQVSYQVYLLDDNIYGVSQKNCLINVRADEGTDVHDYIGDHMISMISVKDKNTNELRYHLLVDSTNVNISVLKDGKIYNLSNYNHGGLELSASGNIMHHSFDDTVAIADAVIDSRARSEQIDIEELTELYGVQALNESLYSTRKRFPRYDSRKQGA